MQIRQLFIVTILVTVFSNPTKLTNDLFILTSGIPSVNTTDLQALTLAGPTVTRPVPDPLAVLSLENCD